MLSELLWTSAAAAIGTASHFERTDPGPAPCNLMGFAAVTLTSRSLAMGSLLLRHHADPLMLGDPPQAEADLPSHPPHYGSPIRRHRPPSRPPPLDRHPHPPVGPVHRSGRLAPSPRPCHLRDARNPSRRPHRQSLRRPGHRYRLRRTDPLVLCPRPFRPPALPPFCRVLSRASIAAMNRLKPSVASAVRRPCTSPTWCAGAAWLTPARLATERSEYPSIPRCASAASAAVSKAWCRWP